MPGELHRPTRRGWMREYPATPIAALAVAVIAADPSATTGHQVLLILAVLVAIIGVGFDLGHWWLDRHEPGPDTAPRT